MRFGNREVETQKVRSERTILFRQSDLEKQKGRSESTLFQTVVGNTKEREYRPQPIIASEIWLRTAVVSAQNTSGSSNSQSFT